MKKCIQHWASSLKIWIVLIASCPAVLSASHSGEPISFEFSLKTNLSAPMPPPYLRKADTGYYDYQGQRNLIYPTMDLIGVFQLTNLTTDTLKISLLAQPLEKYLSLQCAPLGQESSPKSIGFVFQDSLQKRNTSKNIIEPKSEKQIVLICPWVELSKLVSDSVGFRLTFDNSQALKADGQVTPIIYSTNFASFKFIRLKSTLDSINYFDMLAQNMYNKNKLQDALDLCDRMLKMDSTLFNAHFLMTAALWKMDRFQDAIRWAKKTINVLNWQKSSGSYYITSDNGEYLALLQAIMAKCERSEKWDPDTFIIH